MHENREISSTPLLVEEGRSAKAINHNADVHVLEKSHCAVVPVNQPNKGANALAEVGEGRAQMKENTAQSNMHPTQSGKATSQLPRWPVNSRTPFPWLSARIGDSMFSTVIQALRCGADIRGKRTNSRR